MTQAATGDTRASARRRDGIFYVTDGGFALPTVASALEVRRKTPRERADIRILTTGIASATSDRMRDHLEPQGIYVDELPPSFFSDFEHGLFNKTHVPFSALGRFFMLDCVPDIYSRVLYLDGDTWPSSSPSSLLDADLPDGMLAAAEDQSFFFRAEVGGSGEAVRRYFRDLGLRSDQGYFNSGVLMASAATWRQISAEAFEFFRANTARCLFHDQSALNAVIADRRVRLSPRWNFASNYFDWGISESPTPHIVHFCGGGKPWARPRHRFHAIVEKAFAAVDHLGLVVSRPDAAALDAMERGIARQTLKHRTVLLPRLMARRRAYKRLLAAADIV